MKRQVMRIYKEDASLGKHHSKAFILLKKTHYKAHLQVHSGRLSTQTLYLAMSSLLLKAPLYRKPLD